MNPLPLIIFATLRSVNPLEVQELPSVCEASAAVRATAAEVWIADNERHKSLYSFGENANGILETRAVRPISKAEAKRPRDIEALAKTDAYLAIVGSHSRKQKCRAAPKRARIRIERLDTDPPSVTTISSAHRLRHARASKSICMKELFPAAKPSVPLAAEFCAAFTAGSCPGLNIEGALFDGDRLWLGLRAPVVDGKAVLVRLANLKELRFDAVRLVDLHGRGIRELAVRGDRIGIVAGSVEDDDQKHQLHFIPAAALRGHESVIKSTGVPVKLPPHTEALAWKTTASASYLIAITDGDGKKNPCRAPSQQLRIELPRKK